MAFLDYFLFSMIDSDQNKTTEKVSDVDASSLKVVPKCFDFHLVPQQQCYTNCESVFKLTPLTVWGQSMQFNWGGGGEAV